MMTVRDDVGLKIDSKKRKKALLLHYSGDDVYEIYETLNLGADDQNYDDTRIGLTNYFNPNKSFLLKGRSARVLAILHSIMGNVESKLLLCKEDSSDMQFFGFHFFSGQHI